MLGRVGLGCMRLTEESADDVIGAALEEGITIFDTARAYGESEALLARALARRTARATVITKGGMRREGPRWIPDGRARTLREDCEASLRALGAIDLYLVHAPDPKVPWRTTVRALASLLEAKLVARVGVSNVTQRELDEAMEIAPISAVQLALGASDAAVRAGVVARCKERGVEVIAHSPLGGPKRAKRWGAHPKIASIAAARGVSAQEIVLAALVRMNVVPIPGATRPETVRSIARAARLDLDDEALVALGLAPKAAAPATGAEIVLVMGIQGSGKSTIASDLRDHVRLNRDERAGTMKQLHASLGETLARGELRVALDNTYTTRAARFGAIEVARAHGARVRGIFIDTPLADAQVNVVRRMLAAHGRLLEPSEMERGKDPTTLPPLALLRAARELERPSLDEGFAALEIVPFVRRAVGGSRAARFVALEVARRDPRAAEGAIVFAWSPDRRAADLVCAHEGGPPRCWCRPPLPGLLLAYAAANDVDLSRSTVVGASAAHRAMAAALGCAYVVSSAE